MGYLRPTRAAVISSWSTHRRRDPPSREPGTDYGCAVGTPIHAAGDGVVSDVGGDLDAATGWYLAIDLDDGRRVRYLHLWDTYRAEGQRVRRGEIVAQSGASGYGGRWGAAGPDTVGQHVHTTLFPRHSYDFGSTLDFEDLADAYPDPAGRAQAFGPAVEDDMYDDTARQELIGNRIDQIIVPALERIERFVLQARGGPYVFVPIEGRDDIFVGSTLTGKTYHIGNVDHAKLLARYKASHFDSDGMFEAELAIVEGYLTAINPPALLQVDSVALIDTVSQIDAQDDPGFVRDQVSDAITSNSRIAPNNLSG